MTPGLPCYFLQSNLPPERKTWSSVAFVQRALFAANCCSFLTGQCNFPCKQDKVQPAGEKELPSIIVFAGKTAHPESSLLLFPPQIYLPPLKWPLWSKSNRLGLQRGQKMPQSLKHLILLLPSAHTTDPAGRECSQRWEGPGSGPAAVFSWKVQKFTCLELLVPSSSQGRNLQIEWGRKGEKRARSGTDGVQGWAGAKKWEKTCPNQGDCRASGMKGLSGGDGSQRMWHPTRYRPSFNTGCTPRLLLSTSATAVWFSLWWFWLPIESGERHQLISATWPLQLLTFLVKHLPRLWGARYSLIPVFKTHRWDTSAEKWLFLLSP